MIMTPGRNQPPPLSASHSSYVNLPTFDATATGKNGLGGTNGGGYSRKVTRLSATEVALRSPKAADDVVFEEDDDFLDMHQKKTMIHVHTGKS